MLAQKGFKARPGLTQSVWSHWVCLHAGNISEAGSITKIAILIGSVTRKSSFLPSYLVRISKCETGGDRRGAKE